MSRPEADWTIEPPREGPPVPPHDRLTLRLDDIAGLMGISRRAIERERAAGRMPPPDLRIGRMPLWTPATIQDWIGRGGRP